MTGNRRTLVVMALVVAATGVSALPAGAQTAAERVRTYEDFGYVGGPGGGLVLNWGFAPATAHVPQGQTIKWTNTSQDDEPHTATLVRAADVPDTIGEIFGCFEGLCGQTLAQHFPSETAPPKTLVNAGRTGLNTAGDSRLFFPGQSVFATVTAPPGSTLHYICAFHPWMQAKIDVG